MCSDRVDHSDPSGLRGHGSSAGLWLPVGLRTGGEETRGVWRWESGLETGQEEQACVEKAAAGRTQCRILSVFCRVKVKKCKGFECSSIAKYFHVIATNRKRIMVTSVDFWKN